MSVFRVKKDGNYTVVNNTCLRDPGVSWKAKGLHTYMISMPDDWVFYNEELEKRATDGKDSLKSAIKELTAAGYLNRHKVKNEQGQFNGWETIVYEVPQPKAGKPTIGKTDDRENRLSENPQLLSTDLNQVLNKQNTDNTKRDNVASAPSIPYSDIIDYLNIKCGTKYKSSSKRTQVLINARIKEGFILDDFKHVIDNKASEWLTDQKMNQYLRPETLFGTKFESYLNQQGVMTNDRDREVDELTKKYDFGF